MAKQKDASEKLFNTLTYKLADAMLANVAGALPSLVKVILDAVAQEGPRPDSKIWDNWADNLVKSGYVDAETAGLIKGVKDYNAPLNIIAFAVVPLMVMLRDMTNSLDIYAQERLYEGQAATTPHPAPIDSLVRSMIIDPARATENRAQLKRHGFDDTQIDNIILSFYRTTQEDTIRTQFLRKIIDEDRMYERMRELGYTDTRTAEIIQTWKLLPPPQDLFAMVAKEAFEPDIYTKLGLAAEFPTEQLEWLEAQGISEAWAQKYWIAHWEQPSILQGFEMLHRGVIDLDTLDLLFRAVEIPSFWRDKLTQIAYVPYTRVDVRRMHDLGVIDDTGLVRAYLDLGYNQERAEKMAEFTVKYNAEGDKQLTRSAILESYREDLISRLDASELLESQDYPKDLADYYLTLEDFQKAKDLQAQEIDITADRYLLDLDTEATARARLNKLGLRGDKTSLLLESWKLRKYQYEAVPSKSELDNFLVKGFISEDDYRYYMGRHGFTSQWINIYLEDLNRELNISQRMPTRADLQGWLKKKLITEEQFTNDMRVLGYADRYINLYIQSI